MSLKHDIISLLPVAVYRARYRVSEHTIKVEEVEFFNEAVQALTGWSKEELENNPQLIIESIHEEDRERIFSACKRFSKGVSEHITRSFRFKRKDGKFVYLLDSMNLVGKEDDCVIEIVGVWEDISRQQEYYEVFQAIENAPSVGMVIYQERIVYANNAATEILGYSKEELKKLTAYDIVIPDLREKIREIVQRRLKGEKFDRIYVELPIKTKESAIKYLIVFTKTVYWGGRPAGLVIFTDNTKTKKYHDLFRVLKLINHAIITTLDEEELLNAVCELLSTKMGFELVWVGIPEGGKVRVLFACGKERDYVKGLNITLDPESPLGRGPTATAVRENRIVVNPDTRTNPAVEPWREKMLEKNFLSSCAIPLTRGNKVVAVLNIYSSVPNMFTEEELELLEEIRLDLSFALERIEKERYMKIVNTAMDRGHEWVLITDENGTILYANSAVSKISGYSIGEILGQNPRIFKSGQHSRRFYETLWKTIKSGKVFQATFVNRRKDGTFFFLDQMIIPVNVGGGERVFVALGKDVTSEKILEKEVARLRYTDVLTSLPNREGFLASVRSAIEEAKKENHAMFVIDIANFTGINQIYGVEVGNEILKRVATTLRRKLFRRDIVGRIGGDEFAVFAKKVGGEDLLSVINKILTSLSEPIVLDGKEIRLKVNVGASLYPKDAMTPEDLLEKASIALSFAKREGENTYHFFSEEVQKRVEESIHTMEYLEKAYEEDRFIFYLQPFYKSSDLKVAGFEVLLRLVDEEGNVLPPKDFISLLERSRLMRKVEDRILTRIAEFIENHTAKMDLCVSFNVSPKSFRDHTFLDKVREVAKRVGRNLVLEITERLFMEDPDYTMKFLEEIRQTGVKVAVDDFGTGYSSLVYLEKLPVDILKIDMEFVHRMTQSEKTRAVVETIVSLAKKLGMKTIAEGVETEDQLQILKDLGCDYVQGYYLARPMPKEEVCKFLRKLKL